METQRRNKLQEWLLTFPSLCWLIIFFLVPTLIVFAITLKPADLYGGIGEGWTLDTILGLTNPNYPAIIWRTVWLSVLTTAICILLGTPTGYYLARLPRRYRQAVLLLVIVPFWTSFLVRIFAWKVLLHPEGWIKQALVWCHCLPPDASLLYNSGAVLLVMVYTSLPFANQTIYAAAETCDVQLLEAARDLGAHQFQAFWSIFLPGIRKGLLTATLVVLIPSLGSYVIPDLIGGPSAEMIGNKIAQRVFVDRNLPHAGALSAFLTLAVLLPMLAVLFLHGRRDGEPTPVIPEDS